MNRILFGRYFILSLVAVIIIFSDTVSAQFIDNFNADKFRIDSTANNGWLYFAGDGTAIMNFLPRDDYASIFIDATKDQHNTWWALIKRQVSKDFDLTKLSDPKYELRIEARIRSSHAPRRVNLHLNTQRTTDFHSHLMEYEIPDTTNWYTISMTTDQFDAKPGDSIYGQMALMDWGLEKYRLDVDYFKVDVVCIDSVGPDLGFKVPYQPPVLKVSSFNQHLLVSKDGVIDQQYPNKNFNNWTAFGQDEEINILSLDGTKKVIMQWDMKAFAGMDVIGSGLLELTTFNVIKMAQKEKDYGMVRVVEILGGDPDWDQSLVTYNSFCTGEQISKVLNPQMIIDVDVLKQCGKTNFITISNPTLRRLIEGKSYGLALQPLGAISASFYSMENGIVEYTAKLHFNIRSRSIKPIR